MWNRMFVAMRTANSIKSIHKRFEMKANSNVTETKVWKNPRKKEKQWNVKNKQHQLCRRKEEREKYCLN